MRGKSRVSLSICALLVTQPYCTRSMRSLTYARKLSCLLKAWYAATSRAEVTGTLMDSPPTLAAAESYIYMKQPLRLPMCVAGRQASLGIHPAAPSASTCTPGQTALRGAPGAPASL